MYQGNIFREQKKEREYESFIVLFKNSGRDLLCQYCCEKGPPFFRSPLRSRPLQKAIGIEDLFTRHELSNNITTKVTISI